MKNVKDFNERETPNFPFFLSISARSLCQKSDDLSIKTMKKKPIQIVLMGYWLLHQKISVSHIDLYQNSESYKELKMAAIVTSLDDYRVKNEVRENAVAEIENGYTRIANELLEELAGANLTKRQFKVFLAVIRKTYGWQKKQDRISNSQLAEITNLPVKRVSETRVQLVEMNILSSKGKLIGINENVNEWKIPQNEGKSPEMVDDTQNRGKSLKLGGNKSLKTRDSYPSKQGNTKETITKENKYNNTPLTPHEGNDEKLISNNRKTKIPYQEILQVYNETVGDRLPNAESLNDKRKRAIGKFWKELKNPSVDAARNYFEVFVSGSSSALLRHRPLRTVRASFPAYGSSLSITPRKSRFNNGKTTATGCVMTFRM